MDTQNFTQQKIEDTLHSLDGISHAELPPFFYTRLQGKLLATSQSPQSIWFLLTRPKLTFATLSLLIALNIAAINYFIKANNSRSANSISDIQSFANEYNLSESTFYNENINK